MANKEKKPENESFVNNNSTKLILNTPTIPQFIAPIIIKIRAIVSITFIFFSLR